MKRRLLTLLFVLGLSFVSAQNAVHLDGVDDFVPTTLPAINGNTAKTFEAWIKTTSNSNTGTGGIQHVIADMGSSTGTGGRFTLNLLFNNALRLEVNGNGISGTTPLNDGNWHHVAATYDPTLATNKVKLYVDGNLDGQGNLTVTVNTGTAIPFQIAKRVDGVNPFQGNMDEVRVWNVARSAADIMANKNIEFCSPQTGLVAYYKFNNGIADGNNAGLTSIPDRSGNNRTGTLTGLALNGTTSNYSTGATLTLNTVDATATVSGALLTANETGAGTTYQWIDCDNGNAIIGGETNQTFTATALGNYAVRVSKNGCNATSSCYPVTTLTSADFGAKSSIKIYPNPSNGNFSIQLAEMESSVVVMVKNVAGQTILKKQFNNTNNFTVNLNESAGIYFVTLENEYGKQSTHKLVVQ
ncbi:LamG-like jellyroll fold domain-containing protein [Flavobacterium sp.]|uniref:LamG-like jellyroll fold domain-containing protein n=1 Tax=Flavobacterium sp. TaxID=239 RepID=UPI0028BECCC8|nr:LamG-like jellyroll fold domain-containing protein [Flavobacterium sp.]